MWRLISTISILAVLLSLCGCGGSTSTPLANSSAVASPQFTIASGDWSIPLLGPGSPPSLFVTGGFLTQSGAAVSGTVHMINFPCLDPFTDDLVMTGTVSGNTLTLSSTPLRGQVLSLSLHPAPNQSGSINSLEGSASLTGSCGFSGTATAMLVPPINGAFKGTFSNGMVGDVSATLNQSDSDAHGYFHVSGGLTLSGSPCFTSATVTSSTGFGGIAIITLNTNDSNTVNMIAGHDGLGPGPDALFTVVAVESGTCANQIGVVTLKKQ